jgi:hypothetical protein
MPIFARRSIPEFEQPGIAMSGILWLSKSIVRIIKEFLLWARSLSVNYRKRASAHAAIMIS